MEENIIETLQAIGLTPGEAKVYLALNEVGTSTIGPVVDKSGVSASKVYHIMERLMKKGLVTLLVEHKTKIYSPADPGRILEYLDEEQTRIEHHKKTASKIIPILKSKKDATGRQPVVEISKGRKGFEVFWNEMYSKANFGDTFNVVAGYHMSKYLQNFWFKQSQEYSKKNINQFMLYEYRTWHDKPASIHKRHKRTMYYPRIFDKKHKDLPNIHTLGDITMIEDLDGDELFTLIIRHKRLTEGFRKLLCILREATTVPEGFAETPTDA